MKPCVNDCSGHRPQKGDFLTADWKPDAKAALRDYLLDILKGISMYAHRARQLSVTDRQIDLFTVEALRTAISSEQLSIESVAAVLSRAAQVRDRAKKLYEWICGPFALKPESPHGSEILPIETDPQCILTQALAVDFERSFNRAQEAADLENQCVRLLGEYIARAISAQGGGECEDTAYDLIHNVLSLLADHLQRDDLTRLALIIENKKAKICDRWMDGDYSFNRGALQDTAKDSKWVT